MFFRSETPQGTVDDTFQRLRDESFRAYLDMLVPEIRRPPPRDVPVLVLGAGDDALFERRAVEAVARAHRTEAAFVPDIGHDMMLDVGWEGVADRIARWIGAEIAPAEAQEAVARPEASTRG